MTKPLVVLNIVGLTYEMLGERTPHLKRLAEEGFVRPMGTVLPAVTCSAQSTMLTGLLPRDHGVVGNGWYFRDTAEIRFWLQSNHLVKGERVYQTAKQRDPNYTTAKMFWWYNMYAPVEYSVTPRPSYPADGRKVFDSYSQPADLKNKLQEKLGVFPLFKFWGPTANIESSRWIADASIEVMRAQKPTLTLVYLPHLDYNLQRLGVSDSRIDQDISDIDTEAGRLIEAAKEQGAEVLVVSEYAITDVSQPVHINRVLREAGYLQTRHEILGWETLDAGASRAFAVADHQLAHVYVDRMEDLKPVATLLEKTSGIERVLDRQAQEEFGIDHPHAGDLVVIAAPGAWFTYYFWLDDRLAPDYARTVDIHRKPGYDPVELFVDPEIKLPMLKMARRLLQKKLGFRYYMDMISLDAKLVKGSHGRLPAAGHEETEGPVLISSSRKIERDQIAMTDVKEMMLKLQFE
ncbi:MAG: alkaline phosphatase family protein [Planctomycetaceae bacterium]|nr:alkaline phosphatase family protein [Planctomycetaceae bacterium]